MKTTSKKIKRRYFKGFEDIIMFNKDLSMAEKWVLTYIAHACSMANSQQLYIRTTIMSERLNIHKNTIVSALKRLEEKFYIKKLPRNGRGTVVFVNPVVLVNDDTMMLEDISPYLKEPTVDKAKSKATFTPIVTQIHSDCDTDAQ